MQLAFETAKLRKICEDSTVAEGSHGESAAALLLRRIADLRAAQTLADVIAGSPCIDKESSPFTTTISIGDRIRLILVPNYKNPPIDPDGHLDLSRVRRVKLLRVENDGIQEP